MNMTKKTGWCMFNLLFLQCFLIVISYLSSLFSAKGILNAPEPLKLYNKRSQIS